MREILFRGKREEDNEWVIGYLLQSDLIVPVQFFGYCKDKINNRNIASLEQMEFYKVIPKTIGQYTGLTDKNGTKIFEGDILEYIDTDGDKQHLSVGFEDGCFVYEEYADRKKVYTECLYTVLMLEPEVIGNIYEDKDLII